MIWIYKIKPSKKMKSTHCRLLSIFTDGHMNKVAKLVCTLLGKEGATIASYIYGS
jgi:hypothetical protein